MAAVPEARQHLDRPIALRRVAEADVEPLAADLPLELVRRALGDHEPWSITAMRSHRRSASSRYWVVRRTVVPSATSLPMSSQRPIRLRGRGRSSARRGRARAAERQARRRDRAVCAYRRSTSSRRARRPPPDRTRLEQLARAFAGGAAQVVELPYHLEILEAGQVLVDGGVLARDADPCAQPRSIREDVDAVDPGGTPSGRRRVVRIRTAVVLPAPLGPSRPKTVPVSTVSSTPRRASTVP